MPFRNQYIVYIFIFRLTYCSFLADGFASFFKRSAPSGQSPPKSPHKGEKKFLERDIKRDVVQRLLLCGRPDLH